MRRRRTWTPRVWVGCSVRSWVRLLRRHRFAFGWQHLHTVAVDSLASAMNSALGRVEKTIYSSKLARTEIHPQPLFILGHWRSGTTLLHELVCLDPRFAAPTVYECCSPHHFLVTRSLLPKVLWFLMPDKRPVDQMEIDWASSFEDEFAMCLLGARSAYEALAFPNSTTLQQTLMDFEDLSPAEAREWRVLFTQFLRKVTLAHRGRRLVLKSPPHTCRIRVLLELFPRAQFVHIVRNPYDVFASTRHLWRILRRTQGLQNPSDDVCDEAILSTFLYMHACLERDRSRIPEGQFHELRYEDLVRDPIEEMRQLYERLHLGNFQGVAPLVELYFSARAGYATNAYRITEVERHEIQRRWARWIERYGYTDRARAADRRAHAQAADYDVAPSHRNGSPP